MEWTRDKPDKPGYYLRNNPPISSIVKEDIILVDGQLWYKYSGNPDTAIPIKEAPDRFLWFGPIPIPWEGFNRFWDLDAQTEKDKLKRPRYGAKQ